MAKNYKVFVSHSWTYSKDLQYLRDMLECRGYFKVEFEEFTREEPINSENADYIKRRLREKISSSDIVIGIAGIYASHSEWMQWELNKAEELGVPIIGVIPRGKERISRIVKEKAKTVVKWNTESIVAAIRFWSNKNKDIKITS